MKRQRLDTTLAYVMWARMFMDADTPTSAVPSPTVRRAGRAGSFRAHGRAPPQERRTRARPGDRRALQHGLRQRRQLDLLRARARRGLRARHDAGGVRDLRPDL